MPTVKVKISCGYTDYLNIDIRADESVATNQLTPPKANEENEL